MVGKFIFRVQNWWFQKSELVGQEFSSGGCVTRSRCCVHTMTRGVEMCVLDDANTRSLVGSGCESSTKVRSRPPGVVHGICPGSNTLVRGVLMGSRFG